MNRKLSLAIIFIIIFSIQSTAYSQATDKAVCSQFPVIPVLTESRQAALYFRQFFNNGGTPFAEISAAVGEGDNPVLQIVVTEKDHSEVFYSNSEAIVKELKEEGKEAYPAQIDFKKMTESSNDQQSIYGFGFRDKRNQAILWRFVTAVPLSERGKGLIQMPGANDLRLIRRDTGTLAGEGTLIRVGDKNYDAEPMPEAGGHGFIVYRGSLSGEVDLNALRLGEEHWSVVSCPKELKAGAEWKFAEKTGRQRTLQIASQNGEEFRLEETTAPATSERLILIVRQTPNGLALQSIESGAMQISFMPALSLSPTAGETSFQIDLGKQKNATGGTVSVEKTGESVLLKWQFKSPDWTKAKKLISTIKIGAADYVVKVS